MSFRRKSSNGSLTGSRKALLPILPFMVGYYLGTRISETCAIDLLHDLDLENNEIHITQQLTKEDHAWFFRPLKYESYRTVKFGDTLKQALQNELCGQLYTPDSFKYCARGFIMTWTNRGQSTHFCFTEMPFFPNFRGL